jgi:hypothetical protein
VSIANLSRRAGRAVAAALLAAAVAVPASAHRCTGDCDASDTVTVQELIQGVRIALGQLRLEVCYSFDADLDSSVSIDELQVAVGNLFSWCGHGSPPTPTSTRTATRTPTPLPSAAASPGDSATPTPSATPTATPTAAA